MTSSRIILPLLLVLISLISCKITYDLKTTQIEIMKPGIINIPENINKVVLINRIPHCSDIRFEYDDGHRTERDTTIKYRELSNTCIDALAWFLKKEGYFAEVINYRDSLTNIDQSNDGLFYPEGLFKKTKSDFCIFLDQLNFNIVAVLNSQEDVVENNVTISWAFEYKTDTLSYTYKQRDTLFFEASDFPTDIKDAMKLKMAVNNSSVYLGQNFGSKILPTWMPVERLYYKSNNRNMLLAEKYALENNWIKAAEIWNTQTKNKNVKIAAKACFNMALACEMEGKPDAAIDWLIRSYSSLSKNNEEHKANCKQYISILALRKKEIERLEKQVRNQE